jgi:hypothetical protein
MSCSLSGSAGFEINAPLALKYGHELLHREPWHTFADPSLRSGEWEDERFWMWYTAYGRLGYRVDTDPEVWMRQFRARFGVEAAASIERTLRAASKIIPFITTIHMPVHPSLRYWTEMSTGYPLFNEHRTDERKSYDFHEEITYGSTDPSDHALFYGIDEFVEDVSRGDWKGKYSPLQSAVFLSRFAEEAEQELTAAQTAGGNDANPEFLALQADVKLLVHMARYHVWKIRSAYALAKYGQSGDLTWLSDALNLLDQAAAQWRALSELGLSVYHHDLEFNSAGTRTRHGTWRDLYPEIEADRRKLADMLAQTKVQSADMVVHDYAPAPLGDLPGAVAYEFPDFHMASTPLTVTVDTGALTVPGTAPFVLHYRHVNQLEGLFRTIDMKRIESGWTATIPADYLIPEWDLMIYVTRQDAAGSCLMLPGIYHPQYPYPYHVVEILNG